MKRRFKLIGSLFILGVMLCFLGVGVYSAAQVNVSFSANVNVNLGNHINCSYFGNCYTVESGGSVSGQDPVGVSLDTTNINATQPESNTEWIPAFGGNAILLTIEKPEIVWHLEITNTSTEDGHDLEVLVHDLNYPASGTTIPVIQQKVGVANFASLAQGSSVVVNENATLVLEVRVAISDFSVSLANNSMVTFTVTIRHISL